jgi:hypothetical protein
MLDPTARIHLAEFAHIIWFPFLAGLPSPACWQQGRIQLGNGFGWKLNLPGDIWHEKK